MLHSKSCFPKNALHSLHWYDYTWSVTDRYGFHCRLIITLAVHKSKIMCAACAKESNILGHAYENTSHLLTCVQISFTQKRNKNTFIAQWTSDTTRKNLERKQPRRDVSLNGKENKHATIYSGPLPAAQTRRMSTHASVSTHLRTRHCLQYWREQIRLCTVEIFWALTFLPGLCRETTNPFDTSPWHHLCSFLLKNSLTDILAPPFCLLALRDYNQKDLNWCPLLSFF